MQLVFDRPVTAGRRREGRGRESAGGDVGSSNEIDALARKIEEEADFLAEHSDAAKAVVDFCKHWDREIKVASGNLVDLKMVLCIGLVGFTIFEVGPAAATPVWVTLTLFGLNHFIEMQSELADSARATEGNAPGLN